MARLQTKCFVASAGFHVSLVGLVLLAAAFVPKPTPPPEQITLLTLMPRVRDEEAPSGGNPNVTTPPVAAPVQPPVAEVIQEPIAQSEPKVVEPTPVKPPAPLPTPPKPVKPKPTTDDFKDLFESKPERDNKPKPKDPIPTDTSAPRPDKPKAPSKVEVDLTVRKPSNAAAVKAQRAKEQAAAAQAAAQYQKWANERNSALKTAVSGLTTGLAPSTVVEMPGPGGELYASYRQIVYAKYNQAWQPPADLEDESATVEVEVVIARDGRVISSAVTSRSSNGTMNKSIQSTLDRVRFVHAFPEGAKDSERVFKIRFNLRAKRQLG